MKTDQRGVRAMTIFHSSKKFSPRQSHSTARTLMPIGFQRITGNPYRERALACSITLGVMYLPITSQVLSPVRI